MLINGRHAEELRVAIVDETGRLQGYRVAMGEAGVERGNIYRGVVANIEPSLDAAFIEYGASRHGFLKRHDVVPEAYHNPGKKKSSGGKGESKGKGKGKGKSQGIADVLQKGQPVLVQVTRDAVANKGATLTTNISIAGRYLVLKPYEGTPGVSRKVEDETLRRKLREKVKSLVAGDFGFIVRTNAADQTKTELKGDLDRLKRLWKQALAESKKGRGAKMVYDDQDLVIQVLRDYLNAVVAEILVDDEVIFEHAQRYLAAVAPRRKIPLELYNERTPLFSRFKLEPQIAAIYRRQVPLPSGGSLVIDGTEALTAIDVNSGKATRGESQKDTALNTNLEAADEVARQLRLRDIGGLVVVDFIDMRTQKHQRAVEKAVKEAMKPDKARSHTSKLSANGLLEINRQRVGQALTLRTHVVCDACRGTGWLPAPDMAALGLLRRIEARAAEVNLDRARVHLNPETAQQLQNRRRTQLAALEHTYNCHIEVLAAPDLRPGEERLEWRVRTGLPPEEPREAPVALARAAAPALAEPEADPAPEETSSGSSKRRGRRRRNPRAANGEADAGANTETAPAEEGAAEEKPRSSSSRRRRRRRRKKKAPSGSSSASGDGGGASSGGGEKSSQGGEGSSRRSSGRRRGRRRRRKPPSADAAG